MEKLSLATTFYIDALQQTKDKSLQSKVEIGTNLRNVRSWLQHSISMETSSISWPSFKSIFISLWPASSNPAADMMVK
jgi:hypothetical protein